MLQLAFGTADLVALLPLFAVAVLGLAALLATLASIAHATHHERLADGLDVAHEALAVAGQVVRETAQGKKPDEILEDVEASPEAKALAQRFWATPKAAAALLACVLLGFGAVGCGGPITVPRLEHLDKAIKDERKVTTPRAGFEPDVARLHSAIDADMKAIKEAAGQ